MSFSIAGACPKCGSPLWVPAVWHAVVPPPVSYSCSCNGAPLVTTGTNTLNLPPAMQAVQAKYREVMTKLETKKEKAEQASSPEEVLRRLAAMEVTVRELCSVVKILVDQSEGKDAYLPSSRELLKG